MISASAPEHPFGRLTLKEMAAIADVSEKVARHTFAERLRERGSAEGYGVKEALFLSVLSGLERVRLDRPLKKNLYDVTVSCTGRLGAEAGSVVAERGLMTISIKGPVPVVLDTREARGKVLERYALLRRGAHRVERRPDVLSGEAVFRGTRISVAHVGGLMLRKTPMDELREDFPVLTDADFRFAALFVRLDKPVGRPRRLRLVGRTTVDAKRTGG